MSVIFFFFFHVERKVEGLTERMMRSALFLNLFRHTFCSWGNLNHSLKGERCEGKRQKKNCFDGEKKKKAITQSINPLKSTNHKYKIFLFSFF